MGLRFLYYVFILMLTSSGTWSVSFAQQALFLDVDYIDTRIDSDKRDRLDIYMPTNAADVPVVVYFHGGALSAGSKENGHVVAQEIIKQDIGFVSANYRLSPNISHPVHVQDAAAAVAWVLRNIHHYGGDSQNVYVSGHSSGAYLATLLQLDSRYLEEQGFELSDIKGAIPISPFLYVEETAAVRDKTVWGTDPTNWLNASVRHKIGKLMAPIQVIYADGDADWRKDQINRFVAAMRAVGNKGVEATEVDNRNHLSLVTAVDSTDDKVAGLIVKFVKVKKD